MRNLAVLLIVIFSISAFAQPVDQSRGVDARVDYSYLKSIGPWDDRNYQLTKEDLDLLADNEAELISPVPAFYRVLFRREFPDTPRTGDVQYPRSTYNYFLMRYKGFLIDGTLHNKVSWEVADKQYQVDTESDGFSPGDQVRDNIRALNGEVLVFAGAESAVSISPIDDDIVVAGMNSSGQEMRFSSDGGNTWASSPDLTGNECCDPAMDWKSDGSFVYNVTLGGSQVWFYRSDDNGQTWDSLEDETPGDDRRELTGTGGGLNDKEYIHVDRHPASPFQDNIYITWHQSNILQVATSTDDGNTFNTLSFPGEPRGIGSDITTDASGVVYHFWPVTSAREIRLNRSTDGGVSFGPSVLVADTNGGFDYPIPSMESRRVFIYVSADTDLTGGTYDGRMYAAWSDTIAPDNDGNPSANHSRIQLGYSDDGGDNWTFRIPHETADELTVDRWHQWLKVDKEGRVHVVFYDTRNFVDRTGVDFYHSFSEDGGDTWQGPFRLTSESSPNSNTGFEFGDYNGFDIGDNLIGISIFSDNRVEGGGGNDMDVYVSPTAGPTPDLDLKDGFEDPPPPPPR